MRDGDAFLVLLVREVVQRDQTRVEVGDGGSHVHGAEAVHQERAIVAAEVGAAAQPSPCVDESHIAIVCLANAKAAWSLGRGRALARPCGGSLNRVLYQHST